MQSIKSTTLKRLGINPADVVNFTPLTKKQKHDLHLPVNKTYCPMFSKKKYNRDVAFELLEELV